MRRTTAWIVEDVESELLKAHAALNRVQHILSDSFKFQNLKFKAEDLADAVNAMVQALPQSDDE